jgi:Zn-dependent M28 family amino/carboxypeptidase
MSCVQAVGFRNVGRVRSFLIIMNDMGTDRLKILPLAITLVAHFCSAQIKYTLVDPKVVQARLDYYKGNDTDREGSLKKIFTEAGCPPSDLEQAVPRSKQPNVIFLLPGSTSETIVIGAHFDHVSEGSDLIDNWVGASLLPSLFQSVSGLPRKHTFIFAGFAAEEKGEIGSKFYVSQLSKEALSHI